MAPSTSHHTTPTLASGTKRHLDTALEEEHDDDYERFSHRELKKILSKRHIRGVKRENNRKDAIVSWLRSDDASRRTMVAGNVDSEAIPAAAENRSISLATERTVVEHGDVPRKEVTVTHYATPVALPLPAGATTVILPKLIHVDDINAKQYPGVLMSYLGDSWYRSEPAD